MSLQDYIKPQTKYSKSMIGHKVEGLSMPKLDLEANPEPTAKGRVQPCTKCYGVDHLEQVRGTGAEPCAPCNGTGYTIYNQTKQVKCWLCNGQGEIECSTCHGQGETEI